MNNTKKRKTIFLKQNKKTKKKGVTKVKGKVTSHYLLDKVTIGKEIGKGMQGTVYIAIDNKGNKYAYKIEKMLPASVQKSLISPHWREIDFALNIANKYPNQFIVLYDYKINLNCKHKQLYSNNVKSWIQKANHIKQLIKSPYCSIKLWSMIDGTLHKLLNNNIFHSAKHNIAYDIFIQIVYIVYLMCNSGYKHGDFHDSNIGYVNTNKKYINILGNLIPTHGYIFKAIDFGSILHTKYPTWQKMNELSNDLFSVITTFCCPGNIYNITKQTPNIIKINGKIWNWREHWVNDDCTLTKTDIHNLSKYLPNQLINSDSGFKDMLLNTLYKLVNYEQWQRQILQDDSIIGIKPDYLIPLESILYIIKHIYKPTIILKYLLKNRNI